jgi:NADH:ubiquinone oxidoreductase subunit H
VIVSSIALSFVWFISSLAQTHRTALHVAEGEYEIVV